jgi:hypothetical protein
VPPTPLLKPPRPRHPPWQQRLRALAFQKVYFLAFLILAFLILDHTILSVL